MIPLRLSVRNFLCYGENQETLNLEGVHVACLCGDNGHGKSALLDAMTWALWGQARAARQEDLIHQGKTDMQVDLGFSVGGQEYRVVRRHSRGTRGRQGATDVQLLVASKEGFRPITENSIRETEERIQNLLRMDYTTFTNTAFLLQGKADKFTTSSPMDRKRLLAEVLRLESFERATERAKEQVRSIEQKEHQLRGEIEALDYQLQQLPVYQQKMEEAKRQIEELLPPMEAYRQNVTALEEVVHHLHLQQEEMNRLQDDLSRARQEQQLLTEQVTSQETRLARIEALVKERGEIEERYNQWRQLRDYEEALELTQQEADILIQRRNVLQQAVNQERERLQSQANHLKERLQRELEPKEARIPALEQERETAQSQSKHLEKAEVLLLTQRQRLEEVGARVEGVATLQRILHGEIDQLKTRVVLLSQEDAWCPLCKTPLDSENRHRLEEELHQQEIEVHQRQSDYQRELLVLEKDRWDLRSGVEQQEQELAQRRQEHQVTLTRLDGALAETRKAAGDMILVRQELISLEERLATKEYAFQDQEDLNQVEQDIEKLGYEPTQHQKVRQQVRALAEYPGLHLQLQEAANSLEEERRVLETARHMEQRRINDVAEAQEREVVLKETVRDLPYQEDLLAKARGAWVALEEQSQVVAEMIKRCQWEVEHLEGVGLQKIERGKHLANLQQLRSVYEELSVAFGKNGIQAYLIDEALPELEQEANALLARLTDNRMHLKLETQRQRRTTKGDPIETLDIHIADELGTRRYELFSGGEAFRVNFALRVALSKLLAHRAGAPLPTLFVDEGFGTQDATGRERLVDVINSIQEDFEKIIVITHIDEIKDLFPVRIEVQKTEAGSIFWMS